MSYLAQCSIYQFVSAAIEEYRLELQLVRHLLQLLGVGGWAEPEGGELDLFEEEQVLEVCPRNILIYFM